MLDWSKRNSQHILFWLTLALLVHLLIFAGFTLQFIGAPAKEEEDKPLPAYIYHDDNPRPTPDKMPTTADDAPPPEPQGSPGNPAPKQIETDPNGILAPQKVSTAQPAQQVGQTKTSSYQVPAGAINFKAKNEVDVPLLRILSKATAAKLFFPKIAQDFQLTGRAKIRFLITPAGVVSNVTLVESSGAGVLDQAALETMNAISPVQGVEPYLKEPQYLVVDLIYG